MLFSEKNKITIDMSTFNSMSKASLEGKVVGKK